MAEHTAASEPTVDIPAFAESPVRPAGIERILVAVDGSKPSERAFAVAVRLARALGTSLDVLTVMPIRPAYDFGAVPGAPPVVPDPELERYHQEIVLRLRAKAKEERIAKVSGDVLKGRPGELILSETRVRKADLVVLGARGVSTSHRILLGSVSNAVASRSSVPVLVVRGAPPKGAQEGGLPFDRVLAAVDGSPEAGNAFDLGAEVCRALGLPLRLLTVVPIRTSLASAEARAGDAELIAGAETLVRRYREAALTLGVRDVSTEVLRGSPADAVLTYLAEGSSHLLVVGSRGRSRSRSLFLGSVSTALLNHAPSSILIARGARRSPPGRAGPVA